MSIPKEPRQLMINLMYLVLTAMLALNVSAEIINAFFMIEKGIHHTNDIIDKTNEKILESMQKVAETKVQYQPLVDASKKIPAIIAPLNQLIEDIKTQVVNESGGVYTEGIDKGKPKGKKDKDTPQRILVDQARGAEIKLSVLKAREDLIKLVEEVRASNVVQITEEEMTNLKKSILLDIDDAQWKDAAKKSWEQHVFGYMPVAACYPLFTKFQNDAKTSAATVINFLAAKIGANDVTFDKFEVFAATSKPYILLGETYEAEIALGAFSSQADISVRVGGNSLKTDGGKSKYTVKPNSIGAHKYKASISVKNPLNGKTEVVEREFAYEVGVPSVTVAADKMNVFYVGVENPISVAAAGVSSNDVQVTAVGAGATLSGGSNGKFIAKVSKAGENCEIIITNKRDGRKLGSYTFRVKRIPDPIARLTNNKSDGVVRSGEMQAQTGLMAILENFDFEARCEIQSFTMFYTRSRQDPVEINNEGGRFDAKAQQAIQAAKPGDSYQFIGVRGRCPGDVSARPLNGLAFQVK